MSAQANTTCHDIFNVVSETWAHLAKIGATCHVVPTCHDMSATFPAKTYTTAAKTDKPTDWKALWISFGDDAFSKKNDSRDWE